MKTTLILYCVIIVMTIVTDGTASAADQAKPFVAVVVVDGSPPRDWNTLLNVTKNVYHSLEEGNRILVFLVKDGKTFLRISTVKDTSVGGYADFCKLIDAMHHQGWPFRSNPVSALKGPIYKHMLQRTGPDDRVLFIIVTEGRFSARQGRELCDFADQVRCNFDWRLVLTGSIKNIPPSLLLAANEGRIQWRKLSDALDPASFKSCIQQARWLVTADQKKPAKKPIPESLRQEPEDRPTLETQPPKTVEPVVPPKVKAPVASEGQTAPASAKANSVIKEDKISPSDEQPQKLPAKPSISAPEVLELKPEKEEKKMVDEPKLPIDESAEPKRRWLSKIPLLASVIGGILVVVVISVFLIAAWLNAKEFQKKLLSPLANQKKATKSKSKVLMIRANGTVHRIGDLQRLNAFHIGRGNDNTVTLNDKKVALRHVRIFRRGENLFLKNLAGTPVVIGGKELGQRKKCQLALPAIVEIANNIKIQLFWERAVNSITSKNGDPNNGISNK